MLLLLQCVFFNSTEKIFNYIDGKYSLFLKWTLSHKKIIILITGIFVLLSLYLVRFVGMEFMSSTDEGEIRISVDVSVGTNIDVLNERVQLIEKLIINEVTELDNSTTNLGGGGYGPGGSGGHTANIRLRLIKQKDRERSTSDVIEDLNSVVADIRNVISSTPIPDNFSITIGGEFEEQQKSFKEMLFVLILAIVLVYMVMAAQFESFLDPFIVLFSVPLAVGIGEGSELQIPLARVVCGGLLSSSFITLILIPVLYVIFENRILKFNKK